mmetsp:Transcript_11579/g.33310  ORF Transcript_11579/g.33310 Transcript_11579/m.33310 type:complete len:100 (-) Transcript_11579:52-351(-)
MLVITDYPTHLQHVQTVFVFAEPSRAKRKIQDDRNRGTTVQYCACKEESAKVPFLCLARSFSVVASRAGYQSVFGEYGYRMIQKRETTQRLLVYGDERR